MVKMKKIKINYACFLNSSGYSMAAQNYIEALEQTGQFDIKISPFSGKPAKPAISDEKYEFFMRMVKKKDDEERILIYHCIPTIQRRIKSHKKNIGFATFETFQPPDTWGTLLNKNDAIITPSQFNYKIFSHMKINKPLYYIPHCIDLNIYNKDVKPWKQYDKYTFLFMGIWRERKGYKQLFEAWLKEFDDKDNVQLVIKTDKPKKAEKYFNSFKKQVRLNRGFAPVFFENKVFSEKELPGFVKSVDCLVSPSMGEGFGYPGLQCMTLGIPVIIANHSGCSEYANKEVVTLIESKGFVLRSNMDNIPQFRSRKWAFIEVKKIQEAMRYVVNNKKEVHKKAGLAYSYVREKFNYKVVSDLFIEMIRELYG